MKRYWLNFIEEGVCNPDYAGCVGGRIEVYTVTVEDGLSEPEAYPSNEIRFLTRKVAAFEAFRDQYDGAEVNRQTLGRLAVEVAMVYRDGVKR